MDDPMNPGMPGGPQGPGGMPPPPPPPVGGSALPSLGGAMGGGIGAEEPKPHEEILAALSRIEEKLAAIAVKVGA